MTPIDYIRVDASILNLEMRDKAKLLLGLIKSFNGNGLMMANSELAELLCCSGDHVGKLLKEISCHIHIENPQSRYRKVFYSGQNNGVNTELLRPKQRSKNNSTPSIRTATPAIRTATPAKTTDITKITKRTEIYLQQFEQAQKIYPGTKRGSKTEFDNFKKKHRDWKEVLPLLQPAIERQTKTIWAKTEKKFIPHFQTWINQRRWEFETTQETTTIPFDHSAAEQRKRMLAGTAV